MTMTKDDDLDFRKTEFTSPAHCVIVKRQAESFLSGERKLSTNDFINLKLGIQKAREYYKAEYQNQDDETKKNEISDKIREIETITNDLTAMLEAQVRSSVTVPDTTNLYKNLLQDIRHDVKDESKNISIVMNTGLSAFTENPINLAVVAKSSEGKTYLVTKTISKFPRQYVIMLRKASPKTFTRERGVLAIRVVNGNSESYETEIKNEFTNEIISVSAYVEYLKKESDKDEKDDSESADPKRAKLILNELFQNVYTLVDFRNKILVFLDRPDPALWNEMLSILSHDQEYIVTNFVEGEGKKYVKKVVFRGWPAVIFCTSKDEDFNWKDLETRFQIIEPTMTVKKYTDGVNLAVDKEFGINESVRSDKNSEKLGELIEWLIKNKPNTMTPFPPKKLSDALTGGKVNSGDLMRKIPRLLRHVSMSTLFNVSDRVMWHNGEETYIIVAFRDIMSIVFLFDDLEFGASLSGMGTTIYEFLTNVVAPVFTSADDSIAVKQKEIQDNFFEYLAQCKDKNQISHLATTKESFSRYMKDLEKRSYIKRIKDENDKRGWNVISSWSELPEAISLSERLKKLVTPMEIRDLPNMAYLENRNFTAFRKGQKLVTAHPEIIDNKKIEYPKTLEIIGSTQQYSGYHSITYDLAVTNFNNIGDNGIKTDNTASADKSKNDIAQKPSVSYGVTNFSSDENALKHESRYVLLSILEDVNLAGTDGQDYYLHKGDLAHIPSDSAKLLIARNRAREIQEGAAE